MPQLGRTPLLYRLQSEAGVDLASAGKAVVVEEEGIVGVVDARRCRRGNLSLLVRVS